MLNKMASSLILSVFLAGCGTGGTVQELSTEDAAQLFRSTQEALLQTVLGAKKRNSALDGRGTKSQIEIPWSFELDCPTSGTIFCDGVASADNNGAQLNFTAGANTCVVFENISMDGSVEFSMKADFVGLVMEGTVTGSMTFDAGTPTTCDMDLEMYLDANLKPYFGGTFCGFSVDDLLPFV